jgi:acetylornithine deacetylase/succinyl-diaminopimelate desuccinylase-like protein
MDAAVNRKLVDEEWEAAIPSLQEFVRIPNLTVALDKEWPTNGLLDKAVDHMVQWVKSQNVTGCTVQSFKDEGFSPLMLVEVAATKGSSKEGDTFLMYGHLDKMPHGPGWDEDIAPTCGLRRDDKIYGRGAGDDGYAVYASLIAVKVLQKQGIEHPRIVIIAETSEESGSPHLGHYVEKLQNQIGTPTAVFCLDATCEDWSTMWLTTSLRGICMGTVEVGLLKTGLHSGFGSGIVPDAFRVARMLLARVEDPETGKIKLPELGTKVPVERQVQGKALASKFPDLHLQRGIAWRDGARPQYDANAYAVYMANTWEPALTVTGFDGLPPPETAGNVLNPSVRMKLSIRLPPLVEEQSVKNALKEAFEKDVPYGASVKADFTQYASGWNCAELSPEMEKALQNACKANFDGKEMGHSGTGGTIPLLDMLSKMFPEASLIVTGVMGPGTNMHGPNEFVPIDFTKRITAAIAMTMGTLEASKKRESCSLYDRATKRQRPMYCFNYPEVPLGQCLCCL